MMIGRGFLTLCIGYKTPAAPLYALTEQRGPYIWFGLTVGPFFIGFMRRAKEATPE